MYVRVLFGSDAGKVRFIVNHVARALLANGRAELPDAQPAPAAPVFREAQPASRFKPFALLTAGKASKAKTKKAKS